MLKLLDVYEEKVSGPDQEFSLITIFKEFRCYFVIILNAWNDSFDLPFSLRALKFKNEVIQVESMAERELLTLCDCRLVEAYIRMPTICFEPLMHLPSVLAKYYFLGSLPINLSYTEEVVLFLFGLRRCMFNDIEGKLNLSEKDIRFSLKGIFEKLLGYYNTYSRIEVRIYLKGLLGMGGIGN